VTDLISIDFTELRERGITTIEPLVHVHCAVKHVLPGINDDDGGHELNCRHSIPVQEARGAEFPRRKSGQSRVTSTHDDGCQGGLCCRQLRGQCGRVESSSR
jgi:hypothetical protein